MHSELSGRASARSANRGRLRWGAIVGASLLGGASLAVGAVLGTWQWTRAYDQARAVEPDPRVPIAEVMRPSEPGAGEGRLVSVTGEWSDAPRGLVANKEVDGEEAVLLVLPLTVPADQTGIEASATLAVLAGWLPADEAAEAPLDGDGVALTGYVRSGEGLAAAPDEPPLEGVVWLGSLSTATLAQEWPSPTYSYMVASDTPADGWRALPPPVERTRLDFRSLTYAAEWWLFGLFAAALAARWMRDNGREAAIEEDA